MNSINSAQPSSLTSLLIDMMMQHSSILPGQNPDVDLLAQELEKEITNPSPDNDLYFVQEAPSPFLPGNKKRKAVDEPNLVENKETVDVSPKTHGHFWSAERDELLLNAIRQTTSLKGEVKQISWKAIWSKIPRVAKDPSALSKRSKRLSNHLGLNIENLQHVKEEIKVKDVGRERIIYFGNVEKSRFLLPASANIPWADEEIVRLKQIVKEVVSTHGFFSWEVISEKIKTRSALSCMLKFDEMCFT